MLSVSEELQMQPKCDPITFYVTNLTLEGIFEKVVLCINKLHATVTPE